MSQNRSPDEISINQSTKVPDKLNPRMKELQIMNVQPGNFPYITQINSKLFNSETLYEDMDQRSQYIPF